MPVRANGSDRHSAAPARAPLLRIPPFPGGKVRQFETTAAGENLGDDEAEHLVGRMRALRVGGTYWSARPKLPEKYVLVRSAAAFAAAKELSDGTARVVWLQDPAARSRIGGAVLIEGECDPWHMLAGATALAAEPEDETCVVAAILGIPIYVSADTGATVQLDRPDAVSLAHAIGLQSGYANPFTGDRMTAQEAVELCGFWRALIDSNRDLAGGLGFAFWKQDNVAPLLWGGSEPFKFLTSAKGVPTERPIAVWRSKAPAEEVALLERSGAPTVEVEDGFLRSQGLGADCVPPLSITVDRLGAYFDPAQPSELEQLLEHGQFDERLIQRARTLRTLIVEAGLGKYERGVGMLDRPAGTRRHILVPGQVEDDRSVLTGGGGLSNLELLKRVRHDSPDACIMYKPHPDVLAGHRKGAIPDRTCLEFADRIVADLPISSLIAMADEVHVNSSQAGFEALMRDKPVTAYGVPFYAGWGLTTDKGELPARRTAKRTVDELVAAALLLYPRYLDPMTGLPCPAEVVVQRLAADATPGGGLVVGMRRLQGRLMRGLRSVLP